MTEIFDSIFHKRYVGGVGQIKENKPCVHESVLHTQTYEEILAEYRWYVGDSEAELPEEIMKQLELVGKV